MLRALFLFAFLLTSALVAHEKTGGGLDPFGLSSPPATSTPDLRGGLDPDGAK